MELQFVIACNQFNVIYLKIFTSTFELYLLLNYCMHFHVYVYKLIVADKRFKVSLEVAFYLKSSCWCIILINLDLGLDLFFRSSNWVTK